MFHNTLFIPEAFNSGQSTDIFNPLFSINANHDRPCNSSCKLQCYNRGKKAPCAYSVLNTMQFLHCNVNVMKVFPLNDNYLSSWYFSWSHILSVRLNNLYTENTVIRSTRVLSIKVYKDLQNTLEHIHNWLY